MPDPQPTPILTLPSSGPAQYGPIEGGASQFSPFWPTSPIDTEMLYDRDYAYLALLPIFAQAIAPYKLKMVDPQAWLQGGIRAVADWWCKYGVRSEGEWTIADAAYDRAWMVASQVYPDADTIYAAFEELGPYFEAKLAECTGES
jgi:hypothetical protein